MKILIIANDFPPLINGGNMRVYKFSKYLLKHGWEVHVLCNSLDKADEIKQEPKLQKDLKGLVLHSIPKLFYKEKQISKKQNNASQNSAKKISFLKWCYNEISKYIVPDTQRFLWVKRAAEEATKIIDANDIYYALTSSPPHSTQLIGQGIKRKFKDKIRWIADFRDLWSLSHVFDLGITKNKKANMMLEKKILKDADKIIFISHGIQEKTIDVFGQIVKEKSIVIENGYDPDDFDNIKCIEDFSKNKINFCYAGTMLGPLKHHKLFEGIKQYNLDNSINCVFHFMGIFDESIKEKAKNNKNVIFYPSLPHSDALNYMNSSDVLILVFTNDWEGSVAYSGKFFEYLKIGKPILALIPQGEVSRIIDEYELGVIANPDNEEEIVNAIEKISNKIVNNEYLSKNRDILLEKYNRENLTKRLEEFIIE